MQDEPNAVPPIGISYLPGTPRFAAVCYGRVFALSILALLSFVATAEANPAGGTVSSGSASIVTLPTVVDVNQSSQRAVIDWRSFNIAPNETTNFNQPNANAVTLNRVNSANPSEIFGNLNANGDVILINPNGVFFGRGSKVDVNGLVATTANIPNSSFMQGNMNFSIPGNPNASVSNAGTITASQAGLIGLVAPNVENSGVLNAKMGRAMLGSGDTFSVDLYGDGLISVGLSGAVKKQAIQNSGAINAAGGTIQLTAAAGRDMVNSLINVSGKLSAPSAGMQNGEIVISAAGANGTTKRGSSTVNVSGTLDASGYRAGQTGGKINVTGDNVTITSGAVADASGAAGGGTVNIGGNLHGQGPLQNAMTTTIASGAQVRADAVAKGNGGRVVIWSDQETTVNSAVTAKGGATGGNGGFAETSSHGVLNVSVAPDTSAPHGNGGQWLLDPASLTIANGADTNVAGCPACAPDGTVATSNLTPATIETALNAGTNVTVITGGDAFASTGDITVNNGITATGAGSLTLSSYRNIILNAGITLAGGALILRADNQANGIGYINISGAISSGGGNITVGGGSSVISAGSGFAVGSAGQPVGILVNGVSVNASGGNIVMNGSGFNTNTDGNYGAEVSGGGSIVTAGAGTIAITGFGGGNAGSGSDYGVYVASGAGIQTSGSGNISLTGIGGGAGAGSNNYGIYLTGSVNSTAAAGGGITLVGYGGDNGGTGVNNFGTYISGGAVSSVDGNIVVDGNTGLGSQPITNTTGIDNWGIQIDTGGAISSTGNATIALNGAGGASGSSSFNNFGIYLLGAGTMVSSVNSNINFNGTGGNTTNGDDYGILFQNNPTVYTTGSGNITFTGVGGNGNFGIFSLAASGSNQIGSASETGNITFNADTINLRNTPIQTTGSVTFAPNTADTPIGFSGGVGGTLNVTQAIMDQVNAPTVVVGRPDSAGALTTGAFTWESTLNNLQLEGGTDNIGGNITKASGTNNASLSVIAGSDITVSAGETISSSSTFGQLNTTFDADTAGAGGSIVMNIGSSITSNGGAIVMGGGAAPAIGYAVGDATNPSGVLIGNGGDATVNAGGGNVIINGQGFNGSADDNYGVEVNGGGSVSTSGAGTIAITGFGGGNTDSGMDHGVYLNSGAVLSSVNGNITVTGTAGGAGTGSTNYGVSVTGTGSTIQTTGSGNISIVATGGDAGGSGASNYGAYIAAVDSVQATASGGITLNAVGGAGSGGDNNGAYIAGSIVANGGPISITGAAGAANGYGVIVNPGATITSAGNAPIALAGTGLDRAGVYIDATNGIQATGSAAISVMGTADGAVGIFTDMTNAITSAGGAVTLNGSSDGGDSILLINDMTLGGNTTIIGGSNGAIFGGAINGDYNLTATAGFFRFSSAVGAITPLNAVTVTSTSPSNDLSLPSITAASITAQTAAATSNITLPSGTILSASGNGNALTLASGENFINDAGSGALSALNGRWLVYSTNPANNLLGGIVENFNRYSCTYEGVCPSFPAMSNGLLYYFTPSLTAAPNQISLTYGSATPSLIGYGYTLSGYLGADAPADTVTGSLNATTSYTSGGTVAGGPYAINYSSGSLASAMGYSVNYVSNPSGIVVNPATLTIVANSFGKAYGTAYSFTGAEFASAGLLNGDTVSSVSLSSSGAAATATVAGGPYTITPSAALGTGLGNYTIGYVNGNLTVTPYSLTVTANALSKVYGAADPTLTYTNGALQNGDTSGVFTGSLARTAGPNVGAYAINQGTLSAGANYTISYTGSNLTIIPYSLTVTANAQAKVYGATDPALTFTNGALQNGDTNAVFTGGLTRIAGETVAGGPYAINQGTLSAGANYTISYTGNNLTITPYSLTVTANALSKVYGAADPALTYTNGALQNGDTNAVFTGGLTRIAGETVAGGPYAINQGTLSAGANYTISYTGNNLTITPYSLTVTANAQSKVYGAADPALTYTNGALQNGDTAAVFSGSLTRVAGETVAGGPYAINQGTLSAGSNYTISYSGNNLTITPYVLAVTANVQSKIYGAADPVLTYANGALQNGDTTAVFTGGLTRVAGETVAGGPYAITQGTLSAGSNYTISYTGSNLAITPYVLTVAANAQSKVYGAADPAFSFTSGPLQNGDTASVFTGGLTRVAGQNVGSFAINQGTLSAGANYTISYTGSNLTITPYALIVTANAQSKIYGSADPALTFTNGALQNGDTASVFGGGLTRVAGQNVGSYAITQGTLSAGANYTISYTGSNLTITPYALTVTANAQSKVYGSADPALTFTNGALQNGDTNAVFSGALTRLAGQNVGPYAINQGTLSAGSNYTISYTGNNLTITPYGLSVTANAQSKIYGAADPALTYTNGALQNGDTAAVFSGSLTRVAGQNVGAYAINQGTLSAGANYTISYTGNNLTITPYSLTVTANAQSKVYGAADPALTYTNGALQNSDTSAVFTGSLARIAGQTVGAYAINQGTLSAGANYTISYTGSNLTITPYSLTVTANAQSKVYGAADPALTYTNGAFQNGDTAAVFSGSLSRVAGQNVGAHAINQGTLSAGSNYTISYTGNNLTITPYSLSVTANAWSKVYGAADPALTYTNGALQNGDTNAVFSGALTRLAGQNVGAYAINQGTVSAGANYTISYTGNNLTITPYSLTVTANAQSKVYGAADPVLTYTNGALQNGDTNAVFSGGLTRVAGQNVGAHAINQGTLSAGSNYTISYTGNNLTITPYSLTVTANAQSKVYGAADPALTYTNGALQNGDRAGSVFSGSLTRVAGETVAGGPYAINQGTLSAGSDYTISYTGSNLTITPAALTIAADNIHKIFGASYTFLGTEFTTAGLVRGDTVSSVSLSSLGAPASATLAAAPYAIIATGAIATDLGNYTISYNDGLMFVTTTPAPPSVTVPGTVTVAVNGGNSGGEDGNGSDGIRTTHNTSASAIPVNPCLATAAQDTLPNQMTPMLKLIKISPELAASLPFYKIQTHSFDAAGISCGSGPQTQQ